MEQATKTQQLQKQFICPIFAVWYGNKPKQTVSLYYTVYHAEQMLRALRLNGTVCAGFDGKGNEL